MFACITAADRNPELLELAREFSPRVQVVAPESVVLDLAGLERLLGIPEAIARKIASRATCTVRVAVAANPDAALCAARAYPGVTVVNEGSEERLLGGLALDLLDPPPDVAEMWRLWGLRTFADLSALPEVGLAERLGEAGVKWQRRARGVLQRALLPEVTAAEFRETLELEYPLAELEPLSFILSRLLGDLCAKLETHGMAAQELRLSLRHELGASHERLLRLPFPMRDTKALLRLMQMDLEAHPPKAAVVEVTLEIRPAPPRVLQGGLFLPAAPEPQKLEITLARIARLIGAGNVGSPEILDTHRPDAFRMTRFQLPAPDASRDAGATREVAPRLALRRFRPPLVARVRVTDARPVHVMAGGGFHRSIAGAVTSSAGPWRTTGDWWRADAWARDEWDVGVGAGLYRIYLDHATRQWSVEGCYD